MRSVFDLPEFNATLFYPRPDASRAPPGARDLRVEVAPGVALHLRVHDHPGARALVLLFHGNGEVVADYDSAASHYARLGVGFAVVDYRGYGASTGAPTLRACLSDAHAVVAAVRGANTGLPLVIMGRSLGSACAAELCQLEPPVAAGFIFESGVADILGMIRRRGITLATPLSDDDLATFEPLRKLGRCTVPTLVLHGADDTLIPATEAQSAFDALATTEKTLVLVPGRGHNDLSLHPLYWEALATFVTSVSTR